MTRGSRISNPGFQPLAAAFCTLCALSSCSKAPPTPYGETEAFRDWRFKAVTTPIPNAHFATKIDATIEFDFKGRACRNEDWIEVVYNGDILGRTNIYSAPGTAPRVVRHRLKFMTGAMNRVTFFDTVTNTGYKFMCDTRTMNGQQGVFLFSPGGPEGFTFEQRER